MKEGEEIKVKRRSTDKVYFESPLVQSIADKIDFLRDESKEFLKEIDSTEFKQKTDDFDVEEFGKYSVNQITNVVDDLSQIKDGVMKSELIPEFVRESAIDFKATLNRDADYVRKAKNRLFSDDYDNDARIVQLCDKAIEVNYSNWEAYYIKGIALINLEEYDEAIDQLISSLALNEDNVDARLYIAKAYRLNNEFEDAIGVYDSVLKKDENSHEALKGKAFTYCKWEKYDKADEFFKKANSVQLLDVKSKEIWDECLEKS